MIESDLIPYTACSTLGSGSALVLAPHPDDEVFGCAGALLRHADARDPVRVIILTDGAWMESGGYAEARRQESRAAARVLGYSEPAFWNLPDRSLVYGEWLIEQILSAVAETGADLVYAPSTREMHPDHRGLALAAAEAVRRCPRPVSLVMYEVGVPLQPNRLLDITDLIERKQEAMACFGSQLERQSYDRHVSALNRFRTYTLPPSVTAAEAYRIVTRDELRADPVAALRQDTFAEAGWSVEHSLGVPLVSVVIRSAGLSSLRTTLDAVAAQTHPHIEILVAGMEVGGGVSAEWHGRFPLRRLPATEARSRGAAGNAGIAAAQGRYVLILDEGTILPPDHVHALADSLRHAAHPHGACALWPRAESSALGGTLPLAKLRAGRGLALHAVLFDRESITQSCRFDEGLGEVQDWDFLLQIAELTPIRVTGGIAASPDGQTPPGGIAPPSRETLGIAYEKWRHRWSGQTWADIIASLDTDAREAGRSAGESQRRIEDQEKCVEELRRQLAARDAELVPLRAQLTDRSTALERAAALLADHQSRLNRIEADNRALTAWGTGLKTTLDAITASTSWKAAGPLRVLSRSLSTTYRKASRLLGRRTARPR